MFDAVSGLFVGLYIGVYILCVVILIAYANKNLRD
jgi:hypothetical protein